MKVGIVGVGAVGAATAMTLALRARVRELILINRDRARAKAVATDMHYGAPLSPLVRVADGDYSDLAGAGLAIIAAGVNEKAGGATDRNDPAGRLRLLEPNRDQQAVFPVGSHNPRYGVTLSLPSIVGRAGVNEVLWPEMSHDETRALERSAEILRNAVAKYVKQNGVADTLA